MSFVEKIAGKMWENTAKMDAKRIALQRPTPGITQVTDIAYLPDGHRGHLLDVYYPEGTREPLPVAVSYTHLRAHETRHDLVCRLLLEKKKKKR